MKKLSIAAFAAVALMTVGCSKPAGVNFNLSGYAPEDSIVVYINNLGAKDKDVRIDTLAAPNGVCFMPADYDKAKVIVVQKHINLNTIKNGGYRMKPIYAVLMPGANITVSGTHDMFTTTGNSKFYDECNAVEAVLMPYKERVDAIQKELAELDPVFEKEEKDSLFAEMMSYKKPVDSVIYDFVGKNPDSDAALYMLYKHTRTVDAIERLEVFSQRVREGALSDLYKSLKDFYEKRQKRAQERKNGIPEGEMAPDFTLKNDKGHDVALSSLRGKYIVLDFWGTWCGWCIKGVPAMKEMYKKYSDRLEIVGIACGDTEDVWKECIAKNGMNWTNLINNDNVNVPKMYSIKGFPTKIILDEKGRVLKTVIGESAEFYTYVDSLMK